MKLEESVDLLSQEIMTFDATEHDKLQAVAAFRTAIWIMTVQVEAERDRPAGVHEALELFMEADALIAVLIFGWAPDTMLTSTSLHHISGKADGLACHLLGYIVRWMKSGQMDPNTVHSVVDLLYINTLTNFLHRNASQTAMCLDLHRAIRRRVIEEAENVLSMAR